MNADQPAHESQRKPTLCSHAARLAWLAVVIGCIALPADVVAVNLNPGASTLSLGSPEAPARSKQGGFEIVRRDRGRMDRQVAIEASELPDEVEAEQYPGWRGYLSEKGPSRVVVEAEEKQEIQPLDDAIWELIMGPPNAPVVYDAPPSQRLEAASFQPNAVTNPEEQIANRAEVADASPEEAGDRMLRERVDAAESAITDDTAENYRQLMEFFSQPVFVTPTRELNDGEGRVSFRIPQTQSGSPTIRQGSRARFEIRRQ